MPVSGRNAGCRAPSSCFFEGNPKAPGHVRLKDGIVSKRSGAGESLSPASHFAEKPPRRHRVKGAGGSARPAAASAKLKAIRARMVAQEQGTAVLCSCATSADNPRGVWAGAPKAYPEACAKASKRPKGLSGGRRWPLVWVCQPSEGSAQPFRRSLFINRSSGPQTAARLQRPRDPPRGPCAGPEGSNAAATVRRGRPARAARAALRPAAPYSVPRTPNSSAGLSPASRRITMITSRCSG